MSDFYKKFLLDDLRRSRSDAPPSVYLGAFGKHPGWDDHIEDLGLDTDSLIFAKTLLYVQGIGGQIDSGTWEKLDPSQKLPEFKHMFLWSRGNQCLIGRLWSSSDGKGRTRYPMVICAHVAGLPAISALNLVLPHLERIEQACLLTQSATEVRSILDRSRAELQNGSVGWAGTALNSPTPPELAAFVASPQLGPDREGWLRILYQMQNQCGAFARGRFTTRGDLGALRPEHFRLPVGTAPARALLLWSRFFLSRIDPAVPLMLIAPLEEAWIDAILGEPTPQEVFCLRAGTKALPLATEVPYTMDDAFRRQAHSALDLFQASSNSLDPTGAGEREGFSTSTIGYAKQKLMKWFGAGPDRSN